MIGIHGKMGSGKDTVLERMQAARPATFQQASFAAKLKESAAALFGCTVEDLEEAKRRPKSVVMVKDMDTGQIGAFLTIREFLQRYGTESHRDVFGQNFWVEIAMNAALRYDRIPVFTDVRFENEALAIRERGGIIVCIIGPDEDTGGHASEVPLPSSLVDFRIDNSRRDDNFASLDRHVHFLLDSIGAPTND